MKTPIHFVHGNGFPSGCYRKLLAPLKAHYPLVTLDCIGHSTRYPVTNNWHHLLEEVLHHIDLHCKTPTIALGHSMGGVLSVMAALKDPSRFKAVIILDSPLWSPIKSAAIRHIKKTSWIDKVTPAGITRFRRERFDTKDHLYRYLSKREIFKKFNKEVLDDYVESAFEQRDTGYHLVFSRDIEYQIYRTLPDDLTTYLKLGVQVPVYLVYGRDSNIVSQWDRLHMRHRYGIKCYCVPGTHLFPFEYPDVTSRKLLEIIEQINHQRDI